MIRCIQIACVLAALGVGFGFAGCKSDEPENPYDLIPPIVDDSNLAAQLPVGNFAWLHANIFQPTCANSGCHDGSFEPHFNTVSSSYNTLVNHPVISNNAAFSFEHRVVPGNVTASLLYERMTNEIPNSSGIMPLVVDPGSDWNSRKTEYLAAIAAWINAGAPDMFGNLPLSGAADFPPVVEGLLAFPAGSTSVAFERDPESEAITPILVTAAPVDLWFAVVDDNTAPTAMDINELRWSQTINGLENAAPVMLSTAQNINGPGFVGGSVSYYHRATVDLTGMQSGTVLFLRTRFDDGVQSSPTDIPNEGSNAVVTSLFTLQVQ